MKVTTARGVEIDMAAMIARNEKAKAVGKGRMNARGDYLDESGEVVAKREELVRDYYNASPTAVTQTVALNDLADEVLTPSEAISKLEKAAKEQSVAQTEPVVTEEVAEEPKAAKPKKRRKLTDDSED